MEAWAIQHEALSWSSFDLAEEIVDGARRCNYTSKKALTYWLRQTLAKSYKASEYFNIKFPCPLFSTFLYFLLEQVEKSILMENASIFLLSLNYDYF